MAGGVLVPFAASPAGAAQTVTVTPVVPGTTLTGGDQMNVSASGFTAHQMVTVYECVGTYQPAIGSMLDPTQCDTTAADTMQAKADANGNVTATMFFLSPLVTPNSPGGFDCTNGCTVVADPAAMVDAMTMVKGDNACNGNSGSITTPKFTKSVTINGTTYTTDPGNLSVPVGQTISVTLNWDPTLFRGTPDQAWDCVFFGTPGQLGGGNDLGQPYDTFEKPATVDPFATSFTVQATWAGKYVCDRGRVSGQAATGNPAGTDKSNQFCFLVTQGAVVPESHWPVLLLVPALVAGALLVWRRRRSSIAT
jgi:hypothetical protein